MAKLTTKEKAEKLQALYDRQNAYAKEKYRPFTIKLDRKEQADVIARLESVPNKAEYIVRLIRADIVANGFEN
jgi:hypothetical protein